MPLLSGLDTFSFSFTSHLNTNGTEYCLSLSLLIILVLIHPGKQYIFYFRFLHVLFQIGLLNDLDIVSFSSTFHLDTKCIEYSVCVCVVVVEIILLLLHFGILFQIWF